VSTCIPSSPTSPRGPTSAAARSTSGSTRLSLDNPEWFWSEQAKAISWFHPWQTVFDADYDEVDFAWFSAGRLNASFNCVDRPPRDDGRPDRDHLGPDEPGRLPPHLVPGAEAQRLPGGERPPRHGIKRGDRVCVYMA